MRYAILADIHSNLEALEAAVAHAKNCAVDQWIVLGDTIGYGANPNECYDWVLQHADLNLMGNHEKAIVDPTIREWFAGWAREAIDWTAHILEPKYVKDISTLAHVRIEKKFTFTHGSLHEPEEFHYVKSFSDAAQSFQLLENDICFIGHTHIPSCFSQTDHSATYLSPGIFSFQSGKKYILNPGSVGQPRDKDHRLSFGILDDAEKTLEIIRLAYDNVKAADKIRKAKLPVFLAERLL